MVRFDFVLTLSDAPAGASSAPAPPPILSAKGGQACTSISRGFLKIEWAAGRGQTAHFFPFEPFMGRSEPFGCRNKSGCHVLCFGAFVLMLNYHPPSGGRGISLGLVRQYRCAYGAPSSGVGTPTPRSIALVLQKPSIRFIASRCVRSLRLLSVSGLLACYGSHSAAAPFAFVPRLLEPPSALQLPPPAVSISLPLSRT